MLAAWVCEPLGALALVSDANDRDGPLMFASEASLPVWELILTIPERFVPDAKDATPAEEA